jgi:predicted acyltransferase
VEFGSAPDSSGAPRQRLLSVDALRGFDMCWIVGADSLAHALERMSPTPAIVFIGGQLRHTSWAGLTFYDLIFPLFIFLMGVSLVFSLTKTIDTVGRKMALKRILRRTVLLYACGLFYYGSFTHAWPDIRLLGVLERIAFVYCFSAVLFCFCTPRALAGICLGLLAGYWALLTFVPIRDIQLQKNALIERAERSGDTEAATLFREPGNWSRVKDSASWEATRATYYATTDRVQGRFEDGLNLANHIDFEFLPGRKHEVFWDNCGLLSTIPAIATCLLGVFAGFLLRSTTIPGRRKVIGLLSSGIAGVAAGWLWGLQFPVVKLIWTSSYVLVTAGYSAVLLALFYLIADLWQKRLWCQPFVWLGMNSIAIYLVFNILGDFRSVAVRFAGGDIRAFFDRHVANGSGDLVISLLGLLIAFWLAHFFYRRQIFLRL